MILRRHSNGNGFDARRSRGRGIVAVSFLLIACVFCRPAGSFVKSPASDPDELRSLSLLKSKLPADAIVLAPWDFEYYSREQPDDNLYHGVREVEYFPVTYFVSKAFSAADTGEMSRLLRFVASKIASSGNLKSMKDIPGLLREWESVGRLAMPDRPVYFVVSDSMISNFNLIYFIGRWDFRRGTSPLYGYKRIECSPTDGDLSAVTCSGISMNFGDGTVRGSPFALARSIVVEGGHVVQAKSYPGSEGGMTLELFVKDGKLERTFLMDEAHAKTAFNRLFLLGRNDEPSFERLDFALPKIQVFRLK